MKPLRSSDLTVCDKQAEFLVQEFVPWALVRRVGALTDVIQRQAMRALAGVPHRPPVEVRRDWYY